MKRLNVIVYFIIKRFVVWLKNLTVKEKIGISLVVFLSIALGVLLFVSSDTKPATAEDYKPLEDKLWEINDNPALLLETNCNVTVSDSMITVTLESTECKIIATYLKDNDFYLLSYSKVDAAPHIAVILVNSFVLSVLLSLFFSSIVLRKRILESNCKESE